MEKQRILFLRGGFHKEFAYKTLYRESFQSVVIDKIDSECFAMADVIYIADDIRNVDSMFELAKKVYSENGCSGIVSYLDSSTILLGKLSDYFQLNYYNEETGRILADKSKVRKKLQKAGLNNVHFYEICSIKELEDIKYKLQFPIVSKPTDRSGSKGVIIVKNINELENAYYESLGHSNSGKVLIEEYIQGEEYCAEFIVINHKAYMLAISEKMVTNEKYCVEVRDITPARIKENIANNIEDYLIKVMSAFDYNNGVVHIEFKVTEDNEIKIIEINPRCAGGNLLESVFNLSGYNAYRNLFYLTVKDYSKVQLPMSNMWKCMHNYTLFNSFVHKGKEGTIKRIKGANTFNQLKRSPIDKLVMLVKEGDYLEEAKSNEDAIGTIYLMDSSYEEIKKRSELIEKSILIESTE